VIDLSGLPGPFAPKSSAVTVGTFDGVHRGHQEVLHELMRVARTRGERSVLVTFDPHPLYVVRPNEAPKLLTTRAEKEPLIGAYGIDVIAFVPFTRELSQLEPDQFVRDILMQHFGLAHLIIGYDHGFGRGRSGDVETLRRIGALEGFEVDMVEPFHADGHNISSSKIRAMLLEGDVVQAAADLGRAFSLSGRVVRGDGRGRDLGMPTANLQISDPAKLIPLEGIYAVRANGLPAVMHIGPRPTFENAGPSLEVHILDFEGDLYGEVVTVEFYERIRGIAKFDSSQLLEIAMEADVEQARSFFERGQLS
jgi:riboflavin kinase / FMN adenylyltransferase